MSIQHNQVPGVHDREPAAVPSRAGVGALLSGTLAAALLGATPALADWGTAGIKDVSPSKVTVGSNGSTYLGVTNAANVLHLEAGAFIDASTYGKIKSWKVWPRARTEHGHSVEFKNHSFGKTYPKSKKIKSANWPSFQIDVPIGNYAIARCNDMANAMRSYGESNAEIFSEDRPIKVEMEAVLSYKTTGIKNEVVGSKGAVEVSPGTPAKQNVDSFEIICEKYEAPSTINVVNLHIDKVESVADACALELETVISTANKHQQVKFRYQKKGAGKGPLHSLTTNQHKSGKSKVKHVLKGYGQQSGEFRVVIEGEDKASSWVPYSVLCKKPFDGNNQLSNSGPYQPDAPTLLTDVMAESTGLFIAGNARYWGTTVILEDPLQASAFGIGPKRDRCRFKHTGFRPFNEGPAHSGPFKAKVFRSRPNAGWKLVESATFDLKSGTGLPGDGWHKFDVELPEGKSTIKVVIDSGEDVVENDENNTYLLDVVVKFPCGKGGIGSAPKSVGSQPEGPDPGSGRPAKKPGPKFGTKLKKMKKIKFGL